MKSCLAAFALLSAAPALAQPAPAPQAMPAKPPFSPAVRVGDILYMSGQM